jgi:hypothetical protein
LFDVVATQMRWIGVIGGISILRCSEFLPHTFRACASE